MAKNKRVNEESSLNDKELEKIAVEAELEAAALGISKATTRAESVLAGLLEWVGKTDGRTGFLFAVNTALGGFALGALAMSRWSTFEVMVFAAYFVLFAIVSFQLIMVQYPNVVSPNRSMLFFGTIAGQSFDDFVTKFSSMTDDEYLRDVLHQCHVNSLIVRKKFQRLQRAMFFLILSSFVWLPAIAGPAINTPPGNAFLGGLFKGVDVAASPVNPSAGSQPSP